MSGEIFLQGSTVSANRKQVVIPLHPSLGGNTFYLQWAIQAPGQNPLGWVTSEGLEVRL